jgi:hypothetical protein
VGVDGGPQHIAHSGRGGFHLSFHPNVPLLAGFELGLPIFGKLIKVMVLIDNNYLMSCIPPWGIK